MADEASAPESRSGGIRPIHAAPLLVGFLLALRASELIRDNSFLWHIRAGSLQHDIGRVLTVDPFSFTAGGEPWRTQSWVLDLLYATLERGTDSLVWVNWFLFVLGAVVLSLIGIAAYQRSRSTIVTTVAMIVAMWLFAPFVQPRPVIVSYVLLAALVLILADRDRLMWALVPLFWVWAGMHGSWALGGALVVLEFLRTRDTRLVKVGVVSLGATLMTAHGIGTWIVLFNFVQEREALGLIEEWLPPNFGDIAQAPYLIVVAGVLIAAARGKISVRDMIVVVPFLVFGMTSRRSTFPAAIVLLPYAVDAMPQVRIARERASTVAGAIAVALIGALAFLPLLARPLGKLDAERFPRDVIVESLAGRTPFHDTAVGGYLIYAAWPDRLVYIDDRAELYGYERMFAFRQALGGDYQELFAELGIDVAVVGSDGPLARRLLSDGWTIDVETEEFLSLVP